MHLTPAIMERAYEYLLATPPFNKWRLPMADEIEFFVDGSGRDYGKFNLFQKPRITMSAKLCRTTGDIVATMAHEMIHLHLDTSAAKGKEPADHGKKFMAAAAMVCRQHGWDSVVF